MSVFGWLVLLALVPVLLDGNANADALSPQSAIRRHRLPAWRETLGAFVRVVVVLSVGVRT
jgi:hypothetical protein